MADKASEELDDRIIELIEQNGRISYREIAKSLGISERQAGYRFRRLLDEDVIRVITVVDAYAVGFNVILAIGVQVADRSAVDVAADLATLPNVIATAVMVGEYEVEIMVAVENHAALSSLVREKFTAIPGVRSLHPSLFLEVSKYETGAGPVNAPPMALDIPDSSDLNEVDKAIIAQLWGNALETNENIAAALNTSETTVRNRVNRLRRRDLIHITAIRNVTIGDGMVFAIIGIEIEAGKHQQVVERLCAQRQIHFVATVLGRYDIIAQVLVNSTAELSELVNGVIADIPGIRSARSSQAMRTLKYDYRWRIVGPGSG